MKYKSVFFLIQLVSGLSKYSVSFTLKSPHIKGQLLKDSLDGVYQNHVLNHF